MITEKEYFMGRDYQYPAEITADVIRAAAETVSRTNKLLDAFGEPRGLTSGWRPRAINAATPGAAKLSKHMTAEAIDLEDHDGELDQFCMDYPQVLEDLGLWQEHPAATKGWCHVQIVPPKSGNRVFYP